MQDALQLPLNKKRRIVENRRQLLLNLEQLLRKQNMVREQPQSTVCSAKASVACKHFPLNCLV